MLCVLSVVLPGAYEPPMPAKEHETCTIFQVPSQSKFIAKYFPCKESEILLFEAVPCMTTQRTMAESASSCTTEATASIVNAFSS